MRAQDLLQRGAVKGAYSMLDDVEVGWLLPKVRMHLRTPFAELEDAVLAGIREDRRISRTLAVVRRETHSDESDAKAGRPRLVNGAARILNDVARPGLLAVGR